MAPGKHADQRKSQVSFFCHFWLSHCDIVQSDNRCVVIYVLLFTTQIVVFYYLQLLFKPFVPSNITTIKLNTIHLSCDLISYLTHFISTVYRPKLSLPMIHPRGDAVGSLVQIAPSLSVRFSASSLLLLFFISTLHSLLLFLSFTGPFSCPFSIKFS